MCLLSRIFQTIRCNIQSHYLSNAFGTIYNKNLKRHMLPVKYQGHLAIKVQTSICYLFWYSKYIYTSCSNTPSIICFLFTVYFLMKHSKVPCTSCSNTPSTIYFLLKYSSNYHILLYKKTPYLYKTLQVPYASCLNTPSTTCKLFKHSKCHMVFV